MSYSPFKMKGHTLPGIKQRKNEDPSAAPFLAGAIGLASKVIGGVKKVKGVVDKVKGGIDKAKQIGGKVKQFFNKGNEDTGIS